MCVLLHLQKNLTNLAKSMLVCKESLPCGNFILLVNQKRSVLQIYFCRSWHIILIYQLKIPDLRCTLNIDSHQYWKRNVNCSNSIMRAVRKHYCRMLLRNKACMFCPTREVEEKLCDKKVSLPEGLLELWHFRYLLFKADRQVYISNFSESNAF